MELGKLALALGLKEDAQQKDVFAAMAKVLEDRGTASQALSSLEKELGGFGLKLDGGKLVKLAKPTEPPADETPREKAQREELSKLNLELSKQRIAGIKGDVAKFIQEGKVPPSVEGDLTKLMGLANNAETLTLSSDGTAVVKNVFDATDTLKRILSALPSIKSPTQLGKLGDVNVDKKEREALSAKAKEVADRVAGKKK